jgi:hypothetical protein
VDGLRERIVRAAESVTNEMLSSTWRETEYHCDVCRATSGATMRSCEHIRNFERASVCKCLDFGTTLYG